MANQRFSLACRNYDGTNAIIRGLVTMPGVDLEVIEMSNLADMFASMFKGKLDISEMSLAELVYYSSRNKCDFIGIQEVRGATTRRGGNKTSPQLHFIIRLYGEYLMGPWSFLRLITTIL